MKNPRKKKWKIRRFSENDKEKIIDLFRICFANTDVKEKLNFKNWYWENLENPDGYLILISDSDGMLAGYYGMIYRNTKICNKIVKTSLSIDNMVHPNFRRQGMYVEMDRLINQLAGKERIPLSIGFPNKQARPGHQKAGWTEAFSIPTLVKIVNVTPIIQVTLLNNPISGILGRWLTKALELFFRKPDEIQSNEVKITRIKEINTKFDQLWDTASKNLKIAGVRDSKRIDWRFIQVPLREYIIFGAEKKGKFLAYIVLRIVTIRGMKIGLIVDILASPEADNALLKLLHFSEHYFSQKEVSICYCIMLPGRYYQILKSTGYFQLPRRFEPKEWIFITHINDSNLDKAFINNPNNWHITLEDTDVF